MIKVAYVLTPIDFGGSEKVSLTFLKNVTRSIFDVQIIALLRPWEEKNIFIDDINQFNYVIHKIFTRKHVKHK